MKNRKTDRTHFHFRFTTLVARQESRVALRATSLAAAVAQNGYFDPNVAPAQQRNINALLCSISCCRNHLTVEMPESKE